MLDSFFIAVWMEFGSLMQIVRFYQSDSGDNVFAAHNPRIVTWWQVCNNRRLPCVPWSVAAAPDIAHLVADDDPEMLEMVAGIVKRELHAKVTRAASGHELLERLADHEWDLIITDISMPLYAKYFSEAELRDLIAFYRSSTGTRMLEVTPNLFAESMAKSEQVLGPMLEDIIHDISGDETKKLQKEIATLVESHHGKAKPANRTKRRAVNR